MKKLFIVPIEPIEKRYTKQWYYKLPDVARGYLPDNWEVVNLEVDLPTSGTTSSGAFLNFAETVQFKASQAKELSILLASNVINDGDAILFCDAWNPAILDIKYQIELTKKDVKLFGIWHAGSYDPTDILGMVMDKSWSLPTERAMFHALDCSFFGTHFHRTMFMANLGIDSAFANKAVVVGYPLEMMLEEISKIGAGVNRLEKKDKVVFTGRLNSDKMPELVRGLKPLLEDNNIELVLTQELNLTKDAYYRTLWDSKVVISTALHENLGIGVGEGILCGCYPIVPDRSSYKEIYSNIERYSDSLLTTDQHLFQDTMVNMIKQVIDNFDDYQEAINSASVTLTDTYFSSRAMFGAINDIT